MPGQSPQALKGALRVRPRCKSIKDTEPSIPLLANLNSFKASAAPWTAQSPRITATVSLGSTSPDSKKDRSSASVIPTRAKAATNASRASRFSARLPRAVPGQVYQPT